MTSFRLFSALAALSALVGCVYLPLSKVPQLDASNLAASGKASIQLHTAFTAGRYRAQGASDLLPYAQGDVQHVVLQLYRSLGVGTESVIVGAGGQPVTMDLPAASLSVPVSFYNLHPNTTYRIKAFAYKASTVATDDLISLEASSSVDVAVVTDQRPAGADLPVQLIDRLFRGQAGSSLNILPGTLTGVDEGIDVATPSNG